MARPKCLMRDLTNLNRIYKAHRSNVWWIMKVFRVHWDSHYKDGMEVRPSYSYNGNSYTDKMTSSYWISPSIILGKLAQYHSCWCLASPAHQQLWYCLSKICMSVSSIIYVISAQINDESASEYLCFLKIIQDVNTVHYSTLEFISAEVFTLQWRPMSITQITQLFVQQFFSGEEWRKIKCLCYWPFVRGILGGFLS